MPLPIVAALVSALAPALANTAADRLFAQDHPLKDAAQNAALAVAQEVTGITISSPQAAETAASRITSDDALGSEFQRLLNERLALMTSAENERLRLHLADVQDARRAEVARNDGTTRTLAFTLVGGALGVSLVLLCGALFGAAGLRDPTLATVVGAVLGYLFAEAKQVTAYYFGSSAGSKAKDEAMRAHGFFPPGK